MAIGDEWGWRIQSFVARKQRVLPSVHRAFCTSEALINNNTLFKYIRHNSLFPDIKRYSLCPELYDKICLSCSLGSTEVFFCFRRNTEFFRCSTRNSTKCRGISRYFKCWISRNSAHFPYLPRLLAWRYLLLSLPPLLVFFLCVAGEALPFLQSSNDIKKRGSSLHACAMLSPMVVE